MKLPQPRKSGKLLLPLLLLGLVAAWLFLLRTPRLEPYLSPPLNATGDRLAVLAPAGWRVVYKQHSASRAEEFWHITLRPTQGPAWLPAFLKDRLFPHEGWAQMEILLHRMKPSYLAYQQEMVRQGRMTITTRPVAGSWIRKGDVSLGACRIYPDRHLSDPSLSRMERQGGLKGWMFTLLYERSNEAVFDATVQEIAESPRLVPGPKGATP